MLYHFNPKLFAERKEHPDCGLIDFSCPELGITLLGDGYVKGADLTTRRPYPNKRFLVSCRNKGRAAVNGFLVETEKRLAKYTSIARWVIDCNRTATHIIDHIVLDEERDAVTEDLALCYATCPEIGGYDSRLPDIMAQWSPASSEPRLEITPENRNGIFSDKINEKGEIVERRETFYQHTIEKDRLIGPYHYTCGRRPSYEDAFHV